MTICAISNQKKLFTKTAIYGIMKKRCNMEKGEDIMKIKSFGETYDVFVSQSGSGKDTQYIFLTSDTFEPFCKINIPYLGESDTIIAVKNYSENEGLLEQLEKAGVIVEKLGEVESGFVKIPLVRIDKEKLLAL